MGLSQPLFAQEDILKDYAENNHSRKFCLYPSTLRMINLEDNEAFDELASSLEKLLIYQLDSTSITDKSFNGMLTEYRDEGYEEYMYVLGAGNSTVILGKEKRVNEMVGVVGADEQAFAFFLRGNISWQKIPTLLDTMKETDLFNILQMNTEKWD